MRITHGRTWLAPVVVSLLSACGEPDVVDAGYTVRDSSGVTIVESRSAAWSAGEFWTVSDEPVLEIGVVEGDQAYMFSGVFAAHRLPDGAIALLDWGSAQLRLFDPEGRHVRSVGGRGEGPGEFLLPVGIYQGADESLVVWDARLGSGSVFTPEGQFLRAFTLPDMPGSLRFPEGRGVFSDGGIFAMGSPPIEETPRVGLRWEIKRVARYPTEDGNPIVLGDVHGTQCDPARDGECHSLAYGANRATAFRGDRIYLGYPDLNEIRVARAFDLIQGRITVFSSEAILVRTISLPAGPEPLVGRWSLSQVFRQPTSLSPLDPTVPTWQRTSPGGLRLPCRRIESSSGDRIALGSWNST